jgi:hypothetical protein
LQVQVVNLMGEQVQQFNLDPAGGKATFRENLPSGIYFLQVNDGIQNLETRKIVKK